MFVVMFKAIIKIIVIIIFLFYSFYLFIYYYYYYYYYYATRQCQRRHNVFIKSIQTDLITTISHERLE